MSKKDVCITFGEKVRSVLPDLQWAIYGGNRGWYELYPNKTSPKLFNTEEELLEFLDSNEWKGTRWHERNTSLGDFEIYYGCAPLSKHRKFSLSSEFADAVRQGRPYKYDIK